MPKPVKPAGKGSVAPDEEAPVEEQDPKERLDEAAPDETQEETSEETPAEEASPDETSDETSAEEPESAEQIRAALEENARLKAENESLKAGKEPAAEPNGKAGTRASALSVFAKDVLPAVKQRFTHPEATAQDQYEAVQDFTDKFLQAYHHDHVSPVVDKLAERIISLDNEVTIRDLRAEDAMFRKALEPRVRAELAKLPWAERVKPDTVQSVVDRLRGASARSQPAKPAAGRSSAGAALGDLAAGGAAGAQRPSAGIKLTPAQEADYQGMVAEGTTLSREQYYAKWKGRADVAKKAGRKAPATYRDFS